MRVRVSLDFDILIESFISLCIIEMVGAIFRENKQWMHSDEIFHFGPILLSFFG
jgi:hypothetical protein